MSKRIVYCADGTWDDPQSNTNVYKLFKALPTSSEQIAFYDDGVGSDGSRIDKIIGGAFGNKLLQKIKEGYTKIAHTYEKNDDIFLFGFSRGAYTARSVAGMIAVCGLPTGPFDDKLIDAAFKAYKNPDQRDDLAKKYSLHPARIKMIGVWETVGSLGIPAIFGKIDKNTYGFLDTELHENVLNAYHALSIDERREEFPATLWATPRVPVPGQTIQQVWFSGVHCDIGGGYPESGLSDITFSWMLKKAMDLNLQVDPSVAAQYASLDAKNSLGKLHNSWNMLWLFPKVRHIEPDSALSNSVAIRCQYSDLYQPENLILNNRVPASSYQIEHVITPPSWDHLEKERSQEIESDLV